MALQIFEVVQKVMLSIALGGLIGLEREFGKEVEKKIITMGIRTSILVSLLGLMFAFLSNYINANTAIVVGISCIAIISTVAYIARLILKKMSGMTTYVATFLCFFSGLFVGLNEYFLAIIIAIITTAFLAIRKEMHEVVKGLTRKELISAIEFVIISLVILPILPNQYIDALRIFNPFYFWVIVVAVSGVSFISFLALKKFSREGYAISGFFGGMINSEMTTYLISKKVRENKEMWENASYAIMLSSISMLVVNYFIAVISFKGVEIIEYLFLPLFSPVIFGVIWILKRPRRNVCEEIKMSSPLAIGPALKFASLFFIFMVGINISSSFGFIGNLILSLIGGLVSSRATIAAIASLAGSGNINVIQASNLCVFASIIGILNKIMWVKVSNNNKLIRKTLYYSILLSSIIFITLLIQNFLLY